jgi:D-alanyl-D-alanine carboxypeptidase (penicillin-binding protein 5/6)
MKTRLLLALLLALAGATTAAFAQVPTIPPKPVEGPKPIPAPPVPGAFSYILMDFNSGKTLVDGKGDERVEPASITKVMTTYVVFKELADGDITLEDTVTVSENAWRTGGSRMFVDPTMSPTVADLLRGIIIQSGNDAACACRARGGHRSSVPELMNHAVALAW